MNTNDCNEFREKFEELEESPDSLNESIRQRLLQHVAACRECMEWKKQTEDMLAATAAMVQFDVPEQLTQRIMSSVDAESKSLSITYGFLVPVAAVCAVLLVTIVPLDTMEGVASTVVSLVALALLKVVIGQAKSEEMVA